MKIFFVLLSAFKSYLFYPEDKKKCLALRLMMVYITVLPDSVSIIKRYLQPAGSNVMANTDLAYYIYLIAEDVYG